MGYIGYKQYVVYSGEFRIVNHAKVSKEVLEESVVYMGYEVHWSSRSKPYLESIRLKRRNGVSTAKASDVSIQPYVMSSNEFGVVDEETVLSDGLDMFLKDIPDYQVNKYFYLVLRVEAENYNMDNDIEYVEIGYRLFGVKYYQVIPFHGGLVIKE